EGILLEVSNSLSTEGGGAICSGSEFTDEEPDLPPGMDPSPDGDPTLCRVLTITSPISGETIMVYKKDGPFEPRLRLLIAEFDGSEFEDFKDITESVIAITDIIPDPTRLTGRGRWSAVEVTCAILSEVCNGLDDDGDGLIDEDLPVGDPTVDADGDGFPLCPAAGQAGDCSDTNPDVNPGRIEDCDNGLDDNCDGLLDEADPQCDFLLVELSSFTASGGPAGVLLDWTTISEIDNEGFRVLRARGNGDPVLLTPDLIPARGGLFQATHYEYLDPEWQLPGTVLYYLEDVDSNGTITRHGPVEIRIRRPVGVKPKGRPEGR
ncbi:MAG: putative metal-binding motif-containing protein, partial [Acidobacteria bacterium]|nr:putative metal-binding motif-containing protein [Acidobacteriota bacterium]